MKKYKNIVFGLCILVICSILETLVKFPNISYGASNIYLIEVWAVIIFKSLIFFIGSIIISFKLYNLKYSRKLLFESFRLFFIFIMSILIMNITVYMIKPLFSVYLLSNYYLVIIFSMLLPFLYFGGKTNFDNQ